MVCPDCAIEMVEEVHRHIAVDRCTRCRNLWFDRGEVLEYISCRAPWLKLDGGEDFLVPKSPRYPPSRCPRCSRVALEVGFREQGSFGWCRDCGGFLFSQRQVEDILRSQAGGGVVGVGPVSGTGVMSAAGDSAIYLAVDVAIEAIIGSIFGALVP